MSRGLFVCGLESKTSSSLPGSFFALSVFEGRVISERNFVNGPGDYVRPGGLFSVSLSDACAIVPSFFESGDGVVRVWRVDLLTGKRTRLFGGTIDDDPSEDSKEDEEEEEEDEEEDNEEDEENSNLPDFEFLFDGCIDSKRKRLMFAAGCSGGGSGYNTYVNCVDLENKRQRVWITTNHDDEDKDPFFSIPARRTNVDQPSIRTLQYGSPVCDSNGFSFWPAVAAVEDFVFFGALHDVFLLVF